MIAALSILLATGQSELGAFMACAAAVALALVVVEMAWVRHYLLSSTEDRQAMCARSHSDARDSHCIRTSITRAAAIHTHTTSHFRGLPSRTIRIHSRSSGKSTLPGGPSKTGVSC